MLCHKAVLSSAFIEVGFMKLRHSAGYDRVTFTFQSVSCVLCKDTSFGVIFC